MHIQYDSLTEYLKTSLYMIYKMYWLGKQSLQLKTTDIHPLY